MPENENKKSDDLNNFEKLQKEYEQDFEQNQSDSVKSGIWSTLGTFRFIGFLMDLYVPKFVEFLAGLAGGNNNSGNTPDDNDADIPKGFVLGSDFGAEEDESEDSDSDEEKE